MSIGSLYHSTISKIKTRLHGQQAFVCFYCGAVYHNLDEYNQHVESMHYHER
ncbi:hypothetical protein COEREDRAFT_81120 [Coemansia reversa NRRL 1564]|uniref:C2H2-type domain-containing protein n=1 Tax=Coemansia reversa (strain ATCC 12441 / NRRL 1564) TaxID=763665 RepID=A0A2G5BBR4_COERN|nr:hypothetical protein COEREDRAFT_81120 [Coemansia reversa NRRL 1564]|eukprot:PIA16441.1 hypothetical protein COEREDRAFT_81120 [Coemansia reversa NRRL 1564]